MPGSSEAVWGSLSTGRKKKKEKEKEKKKVNKPLSIAAILVRHPGVREAGTSQLWRHNSPAGLLRALPTPSWRRSLSHGWVAAHHETPRQELQTKSVLTRSSCKAGLEVATALPGEGALLKRGEGVGQLLRVAVGCPS